MRIERTPPDFVDLSKRRISAHHAVLLVGRQQLANHSQSLVDFRLFTSTVPIQIAEAYGLRRTFDA